MRLTALAARPLWLASGSQRRRCLLEAAGIAVVIRPAGIDDGRLEPHGGNPTHWVMSLAYLKGRWVADDLRDGDGDDGDGDEEEAAGTILAADTVCVDGERILGQPASREAAREMLVSLRGREHETMTGVCVLPVAGSGRWLFADRATVRIGDLSDDEIDRYVESEEWRGKAGGYNLADRLEAGWPIDCVGDPCTVMGLPMRRLEPFLARFRDAGP